MLVGGRGWFAGSLGGSEWRRRKRMVSPQALKLNEILRNAPKAVDMDLAHQREVW